jgi:Ca2+-binding EF-hand superfamily protein
MEKLFNRSKYSKATALKREEFFSLLKTLDSSIDDQESQYVFEKFDADGNGLIDLD